MTPEIDNNPNTVLAVTIILTITVAAVIWLTAWGII